MRLVYIVVLGIALVEATADHKVSRRRSPLWNATVLDKLRSSLLLTYDKFARPAQPGNATRVLVDWTLRHVDLDELRATLTVNGWLRLSWLDEKLRWTPLDFDGVSQVHVASHEIWQPDIVLYNGGGADSALDYYGNTQCVVQSDGTVLWVPPFEFAAPCALDLARWPYDVQTCRLELGSWTYDGDELDLQLGEHHVEQELLVHSTEWQVQNVQRARHDGRAAWSDETRVTLTYDLVLARRAPAYTPIVLTPAFVIIVMTLLTFWLPPNAGEKLILHVATVIIVCMVVLHVGHKCAGGGPRAPLLLLFYSSSLYVVTCSLVGSVCVLWLSRTHHRRPLPTALRRALHTRWARWLALHAHVLQPTGLAHGDELHSHDDDSTTSSDRQGILLTSTDGGAACSNTHTDTDWMLLAAAIDRISFFFYTILFAILAILYAI